MFDTPGISEIAVCNGKNDCSNGEDELNCTDIEILESFVCKDGKKIKSQFVCNFINDSDFGEDEEDCSNL